MGWEFFVPARTLIAVKLLNKPNEWLNSKKKALNRHKKASKRTPQEH